MSYCRYIGNLSKEMRLALAVDAVCRIVGKKKKMEKVRSVLDARK